MLTITVPKWELFNERTSEFIQVKEQILCLEHSLVSISKWESKWKKPYLDDSPMTPEESIDYIKCMTITQNVNPLVYNILTDDNLNKIQEYIESPMTATWFSNDNKKVGKGPVVTSEIIYYWMITFGIPMECQKWHLNRLLTLIQVCNEKNKPKKKMSKKEIGQMYKSINAKRKAQSSKR